MENEIGRTPEHVLEDYLCESDGINLRQIEEGLFLGQRQFRINGGRIDILAGKYIDDRIQPVIIELKATAEYPWKHLAWQGIKYYRALSLDAKRHEDQGALMPVLYFVTPATNANLVNMCEQELPPNVCKYFEVRNTGRSFEFSAYAEPTKTDAVKSYIERGFMQVLKQRGTYTPAVRKVSKSLGLPKILDPLLVTGLQVLGIAGTNMYNDKRKKNQKHI